MACRFKKFPFEKIGSLPDKVAINTKARMLQICMEYSIPVSKAQATRTIRGVVGALTALQAFNLSDFGLTDNTITASVDRVYTVASETVMSVMKSAGSKHRSGKEDASKAESNPAPSAPAPPTPTAAVKVDGQISKGLLPTSTSTTLRDGARVVRLVFINKPTMCVTDRGDGVATCQTIKQGDDLDQIWLLYVNT